MSFFCVLENLAIFLSIRCTCFGLLAGWLSAREVHGDHMLIVGRIEFNARRLEFRVLVEELHTLVSFNAVAILDVANERCDFVFQLA